VNRSAKTIATSGFTRFPALGENNLRTFSRISIDADGAKNSYEKTSIVVPMRDYLGIDSLAYLSVEELMKAVTRANDSDLGYCDACFTGNYTVPVDENMSKDQFEWEVPASRTT